MSIHFVLVYACISICVRSCMLMAQNSFSIIFPCILAKYIIYFCELQTLSSYADTHLTVLGFLLETLHGSLFVTLLQYSISKLGRRRGHSPYVVNPTYSRKHLLFSRWMRKVETKSRD